MSLVTNSYQMRRVDPLTSRNYRGIVVDNADPLRLRRIKVTVQGRLEGPIDLLPWCAQLNPADLGGTPGTSQTVVPIVGSEVAVDFRNGIYAPSYVGFWTTGGVTQPEYSAPLPNNSPTTYGNRDPNGNQTVTDMATGQADYIHQSGSYTRYNSEGDIEIRAARNMTLKAVGDLNIAVDGNINLFVNGKFVVGVGGDLDVDAAGTFNADAAIINLNGGGKNAARFTDPVVVPSSHAPGQITAGSPTVFIGDTGSPSPTSIDTDPTTAPTTAAELIAAKEVIEIHGPGIITYDTPPTTTVPIDEKPEESDDNVVETGTPPTSCAAYTHPNYAFKLSENFSLAQLSSQCVFPHQLVAQHGLSIQQIVCNLQALCENILEPLKSHHRNIRVNSAFRKGSGRSQHERGQACDIQAPGLSNKQMYDLCIWCKDNLPYDQIIFEYGRAPWIHMSFNRAGNRPKSASNKVMTMKGGKYSPGIHLY